MAGRRSRPPFDYPLNPPQESRAPAAGGGAPIGIAESANAETTLPERCSVNLRIWAIAFCVCQKKQKTPGGAVRLLPDAPPSFATPCHVVVGVADAVTVGREGNLNAHLGLRFVSGGPAPMAIFSQPGPLRVHLGPTRHAAIMGRTAGPRSSTYARP